MIPMDWQSIASVFGIFVVIISAGVIYLRLYIGSELNQLKLDMLNSMKNDFYTRELAESKFNEIYSRLRHIEEKIAK